MDIGLFERSEDHSSFLLPKEKLSKKYPRESLKTLGSIM